MPFPRKIFYCLSCKSDLKITSGNLPNLKNSTGVKRASHKQNYLHCYVILKYLSKQKKECRSCYNEY